MGAVEELFILDITYRIPLQSRCESKQVRSGLCGKKNSSTGLTFTPLQWLSIITEVICDWSKPGVLDLNALVEVTSSMVAFSHSYSA